MLQATDSMKLSMTNFNIERDTAVRELRKAKQELERVEKETEQVNWDDIDLICQSWPNFPLFILEQFCYTVIL